MKSIAEKFIEEKRDAQKRVDPQALAKDLAREISEVLDDCFESIYNEIAQDVFERLKSTVARHGLTIPYNTFGQLSQQIEEIAIDAARPRVAGMAGRISSALASTIKGN